MVDSKTSRKLVWWKVVLAWPLLLFIFVKSRRFYNSSRSKKKRILEQKRYYWIKKYSTVLLWFYSLNYKVFNAKHWSYGASVIILKTIDNLLPLVLIKINDFKKHAPITLCFPKNFIQNLPIILKYFYLSLNNFILIEHSNPVTQLQIVKNILIPRSLLFVFPGSSITKNVSLAVALVTSSLSNLYLVDNYFNERKLIMDFKDFLFSKDLIKINRSFLFNKIAGFTKS